MYRANSDLYNETFSRKPVNINLTFMYGEVIFEQYELKLKSP
jgi:hypothetical protein